MRVVDKSRTTKTYDVIQIEDPRKGITWFISIEKRDGKFQSICESINKKLFSQQSQQYRKKIYDMAYANSY